MRGDKQLRFGSRVTPSRPRTAFSQGILAARLPAATTNATVRKYLPHESRLRVWVTFGLGFWVDFGVRTRAGREAGFAFGRKSRIHQGGVLRGGVQPPPRQLVIYTHPLRYHHARDPSARMRGIRFGGVTVMFAGGAWCAARVNPAVTPVTAGSTPIVCVESQRPCVFSERL